MQQSAIGARKTSIIQTPTISNAVAYAAGDAIGGLLTFANAAGASGGSVVIEGLSLVDKDLQDAEIDVYWFDRTFTAIADNAAWQPSDADLLNCIGVTKINNYFDGVDNSVGQNFAASVSGKLLGTSLFAQAVIRTVKTYASTSSLQFKVSIKQD